MPLHTTFETTGLLKDPTYTADLYQLLRSYEGKFRGLDTLHLEVKELPYFAIEGNKHKSFEFLPVEKKLNIRLTEHRYYDSAGKVTGLPSPSIVYERIRFMLDKAVFNLVTNLSIWK